MVYVDSAPLLDEICERFKGSPWLAVDTEFIRERTYFPQLCLVQLANATHIVCVDPLAIKDLGPLLDLLYDPSITKVFHAAKQDLEIFYHLRRELPQPIFDTQVAAALLCERDQISYAALVEQMTNVRLEKAHTRTDWRQRPLDVEQLHYAIDDVRYLGDIYLSQRDTLVAKDRLHWLDEDFKELVDPQNYAPAPSEAWRRIKEGRRFKGKQLAVLQVLAEWRENKAIDLDKPRKWILRDECLADMARRLPEAKAALRKIRGLDGALIEKWGEEWLMLIDEAKVRPPERWPMLETKRPLSLDQEATVDLMMALVRARAVDADVSAPVLATRKMLEAFVRGEADASVMHGWRYTIVGADLKAVKRGELWLGVEDGRLLLRTKP